MNTDIQQSPVGNQSDKTRRDFEALQKLYSAQFAYLTEKVKTVDAERAATLAALNSRIDELEGNAEKLLSLSQVAKVKNLPPAYIRELIAQKKVSALPVGPHRFKIDLRLFNRELREVMMKSYFWRQAHEKKERRQVDFAA